MTRLSILIPAFNEERTLATLINRVLAADTAGVEKELIVVDNASSDNTPAVLIAMKRLQPQLKVLTSKRNLGKGDAIRRALAEATGDWVLLQDADLEYDPADYLGLLAPALRGEAAVVYGSRFLYRTKGTRPGSRLFYWGNRFLTWCTNWLYGATLTDMCTCYKLLPADLMRQLSLTSDGFEVEAEVTAKLLRRRIPIREVPISYAPRTRSEGKKVNSLDGLVALWTLVRFRWDRC